MEHQANAMNWMRCLNMTGTETATYYQELDQRHKEIYDRGIDIIVPVYKGIRETERCIRSVLHSTTFPFRLWILNDHSPETGMAEMLETFRNDSRVHLLTNEKNLGFTATVNRGFRETKGDVVILNNDTEVFNGWLESLVRAAVWNTKAATVTPYSSNAGIFTLPLQQLGDYTHEQFADALRVIGDGHCMKVPTGHGFCMLIRREALCAVGFFDEEAFGRGYGEETDFCLRCAQNGYIHILDTSCYVYHDQAISFGEERNERIAASRKLLDARYPKYAEQLAAWKKDAKWERKKALLAERIEKYLQLNPQRKMTPRKRLLIAMHEGKGGSVLNRMDMAQALSDEYDSYMLTSDWKTINLDVLTQHNRIRIRSFKLEKALSCDQLERDDVRKIYAEILRKYRIDAVNMSHLLGHTFDLVKECRRMQIPCIYVHHDYYMVCPNFSLVDTEGHYCQGQCCVDGQKQCLTSPTWLPELLHVSKDFVSVWRSVMAEYLPLFTRHCTPSEYCRKIILQTYPMLEGSVDVIEHGRDFREDWDCASQYPRPGEKPRVLILGNIGKSKGVAFLNRLTDLDKNQQLQIHILGAVSNALKAKNFILHGEYEREELPELVRNIQPHYALIPSIFPETYCHTLTEAWKLGLPTVVFDIGVLQERMRKNNAGWILPIGDAKATFALLTKQITPEAYEEKKQIIARLSFRTTREMALEYRRVFEAPPQPLSQEQEEQMLRTGVVAYVNPLRRMLDKEETEKIEKIENKAVGKTGPVPPNTQAELMRYRRDISNLKQALEMSLTCRRRQIGDLVVDTIRHPLSVWRVPGKLYRMVRQVLEERAQAAGQDNAYISSPRKTVEENTSVHCTEAYAPEYPESYVTKKVAVVICIHNALQDVKQCIASVMENRSFPYDIILVNDGSDDETSNYVDTYASKSYVKIIRNITANGYTRAANAGMRCTNADYVILLNSDTIVTAGWVEKMIDAFEKNPHIGILSPLSNAATYQSIPREREGKSWCINVLPKGVNPQMMNMIIEHAATEMLPELQCVNGFCFMIRREVLRQVGLLDEERFPMGYGEEVDYCLRVNKAGFTCNVLDSTYIYHAKTKSFTTAERKQLVEASAKTLWDKHGDDYGRLLNAMKETGAMALCREKIRKEIETQTARLEKLRKMRIAFVLPARGGSGGANSVCQEALGWRQLGFDMTIINAVEHREQFLSCYPAWEQNSRWYKKSPKEFADDFDLVIATTFGSVEQVKEMMERNRSMRAGYYIQDYEPLFCDIGTELYKKALQSYELIPNMIGFAKTDWICETIRKHHPSMSMQRVKASVNWHHYNPYVIKKITQSKKIKVVAMIRPSTPRRRADETLAALKELKRKLQDQVELHCFGCSNTQLHKLPSLEGLKIINHGILKPGEAAQIMAQSDIFVDMSSYQAFGRTGIEGMALGCIPLLPAEGGVYEYAVHGQNALIVDTFDSEAVVRELLRLIKHPEKIMQMKINGLETVKRYSVMRAAWSEIQLMAKEISTRT